MSEFITPNHIQDDFISTSLIGGKAYGFREIKPTWIPDYFIVSTKFYDNVISNIDNYTSLDFNNYITKNKKSLLHTFIKENLHISSNSKKIIVRSSSTYESISDRGQNSSMVCEFDISEIINTIAELLSDWHRKISLEHKPEKLALIIQLYIKAETSGHLSNERRLSYLNRDWIIESEPKRKGDSPVIHTFKIFKHRITDNTIPEIIECDSEKNINDALHIPALKSTLEKVRTHFEWVWDKKKIWIVQADVDPENFGLNPRKGSEIEFEKISKTNFEVLHDIMSSDTSKWPKAKNVIELKKCGLETACLWIIDDPSELKKLSIGDPSPELKADIDRILVMPIVIRTGLSFKYDLEHSQMLPRTNTLSNYDDVINFFLKTSASMKENIVDEDNYCFLIHHFIPSTSSAYCYASPDKSKVRIDSIWGLPDGLSYYAHDSFELIPGNESSTIEKNAIKNII